MMRPLLGTLIPAILLTLLLTLAPVAEHPATAKPGEEPAKHAVLIGINDYEKTGMDSLSFAVPDMNKLAAILRRNGFKVTLLTNKDANKQAIENAVAKAVAARKDGEVLLLALSGHGIQSRGPMDEKDDAFFCPHDGRKSDFETMVRLPRLVEALGQRGPNLVLVDACRDNPKKSFSGSEFSGKLPGQTSLVLSCAAGQVSWETNRMYRGQPGFDRIGTEGHGVFFYHVLEALNGGAADKEGKVTWSALLKALGKCNATAKQWLPEYAEPQARNQGKPLAELRFQSPNKIENVDVGFDPVLAKVATQAPGPTKPGSQAQGLPEAGEEREFEVAPNVKMVFCWVPPGGATLGSPTTEKDREPFGLSEAEHEFTTKGFWLGKYEVMQGEWSAVMGNNPSAFAATGTDVVYRDRVKEMDTSRFPVEQTSWNDCQKFIDKANVHASGKVGRYGLPHEDEWEYACRGGKGNGQVFYWGGDLNGTKANCDGNNPYGGAAKGTYLKRPTIVGSYQKEAPHPWGLCDMHGNVWELCENLSTSGGTGRVSRGGGWDSGAWRCRSAYRGSDFPGSQDSSLGFRLALVPSVR